MKNIIKIRLIVAAGLILMLTSCTQQTKVGFLMDKSKEGRWANDKEYFTKSVEQYGGEVIFGATDVDNSNQYDIALDMFKKGIDILVLIPADLNEAANIVNEAHSHGIKVIAYDRLVKKCDLDFYISFDHVSVGELQAKYIMSACPKGKYVIIGGAPYDNNSYMLRLGQLGVLQPSIENGDIEIVFDDFVSDWSVDEGERLMNICLENTKDIDAVIPGNDMLAEGVIKALKEAGVTKKIFIAGMDAELEACRRILAGKQTMTVYKPIEAIAMKTAEIAMQVAEKDEVPKVNLSTNNGFKQVPSILLPSMIVNNKTIDLTVIADGYLKENNLDSTSE
ncbi:MAG: substrate-binding domain-containing protein [Salinivirgaceae bacterium]|nr:substrate-binding domain-containing protein [Salinivirgaceae bacterium]